MWTVDRWWLFIAEDPSVSLCTPPVPACLPSKTRIPLLQLDTADTME